MSNYDFALDMETDNSNSLILRQIKPGSTVLEVGCAHGRMTKYLREQLNCDITILEPDEKARQSAEQYAKNSFSGKLHSINNASDYDTWEFLQKNTFENFDYILFADVLEHLNNPEWVLETCKKVLKSTGSIFISIPNLAHNGVLIDLLRDKFEYRDTGILDRTHIKFFTYHSLKKFVADCGFKVIQEFNAKNAVYNTEFGNAYLDLPRPVAQFLHDREHGETYQFVWELKPADPIKLSIVTPLFNKWNFTKSYLKDLANLNPSEVEIILIDNGSTDETKDELSKYKKQLGSFLTIIRNETNLGFGKACNQGYKAACGQHIMFLNNDIRVKSNHDNWFQPILDRCTGNNLVGPTGGKVDLEKDFQFVYETNDPTKDINYMSGWCLTAKKEVFDKLNGPFSEDYFCYFEDTHLSFKAKELGVEFCLQDIPVTHFGKVSSKQLNTYQLYTDSKKIFSEHWKKS